MFTAIITAWNEDQNEVNETVASIRETAPGSQIVLIDDGSDIPLKADADVVLVRHSEPWGVGRSRNDGLNYAERNVVGFFDAHMRFDPGAIAMACDRASRNYGIVNPPSAGMKGGTIGCGCDIYWNQRDVIEPKWIMPKYFTEYTLHRDNMRRVPCMMGANYFMSKEVIKDLSAVTGNLWDDIMGRWGFSEQAIAIKAYLLNIPIFTYMDGSLFRHLYRSTNPVATAARDKFANAAWSLSSILYPDTYNARFAPFITNQYKDLKVNNGAYKPWSVQDERNMFNRLFGVRAPITRDRRGVDLIDRNYQRAFVGRAGETLAALYYRAEIVEYCEETPYRIFHWGKFGNKVSKPSSHYDIAFVRDRKSFDESGATAYNIVVDIEIDKYMVVPDVIKEESKLGA